MAAEDLFCVVYAHLKAELSHIKLRESFQFMQRYAGGQPHMVNCLFPSTDHLKRIFQACLTLLRSNEIGGPLDEQLVRQEQADYVEQAMRAVATNQYTLDTTSTLQHVERMVREPRSRLNNGLRALGLPSDAPSSMILGTLAEKYRGHFQMVADRSSDWKSKEERRRNTNREASYAKLHGLTVGEYRQKEGKFNQHHYLREKLCICFGSCHCAKGCTDRGHRVCPCNARLCMKSGFKDVDLHGSFSSRMSDGAARIIDLLTNARRASSTHELAFMLAEGLEHFPSEVILFRRLMSRLSNAAKSPPDAEAGSRPPSKPRYFQEDQIRPSSAETLVKLLVREAVGPASSTKSETRTGNRRPGAAWVALLNAKMMQRSAG